MQNNNKLGFYSQNYNDERLIDVIILDLEKKEHIYLEKTTQRKASREIENHVEFCVQIESFGLDNLNKLASENNFEEIARILKDNDEFSEWEEFYTDSQENSELVDFIAINSFCKSYHIFLNAKDDITEGYTELGMESSACYVSRDVFDIILKGVEAKGYEKVENED